jgi:hypothetical protein
MSGKSDTFENDVLRLFLNGTAIANIADNASSSPITNTYVALHTGSPEAGDQTTSETAYTGYARVPVARTSGGWTVTGSSASPVANIDFNACTASPGGAITHWSVGTAASGAGKVLYSGGVTPPITMAVSVIPRLTTASTVTED